MGSRSACTAETESRSGADDMIASEMRHDSSEEIPERIADDVDDELEDEFDDDEDEDDDDEGDEEDDDPDGEEPETWQVSGLNFH